MKTLEQFIAGLTPMQILHVGKVITAYDSRNWFRVRHTEAKADYLIAEREKLGWCSAEVGEYYDSQAQMYERVQLHAASNEISMDKFYKKMKHELLEVGCTQDQVNELINIMSSATK